MVRFSITVACVIMLTTFLFGCGGDPYVGKYAKAKPTPQTLVGDWQLKAGSPGSNPSQPTKLILRADGSFTAVNYPGTAVGSFGTPGSFLGGDGTWEVQQHQTFWVVGILGRSLEGSNSITARCYTSLNDAPPHVLRHIIGDPDSGEAFVFEKVPE